MLEEGLLRTVSHAPSPRHWLYWAAPCAGAATAFVVFEALFAGRRGRRLPAGAGVPGSAAAVLTLPTAAVAAPDTFATGPAHAASPSMGLVCAM